LAVALLGAPAAFAVTGREEPVPAVAPGDKPIVTVEGNAVVDSSGKTTGYFELALKVKTGEKPAAGAAGPENRFYSASVALRYNATVLQPVSWDYMPGIENPAFDATLPEDPNSNPKTITVGTDYTETVKTATVQNPLAIETKKDDTIAVAEAKIAGYVASDPAAVAQNEKYDTAQITLTAQAPAGGKVYQEDTILCVVRFKYDKDEYPMLEGNTFQFMDGTVGAATNYVKVPNAAQRPGDGSGFDATAVWMANDVEASFTSAGQMAWYEGFVNGEETALYYYVGAPAMSANTRPAGTVGAGIVMPETKGKAVFSENSTAAADKYSYTANLLTAKICHASDLAAEPANSDTPAAGDLVFVLVNAESYAKEGSDPDKMCAVLFYDWDDTLIGTLVVQKDQDARQAVNKYVKDHLIHPELTGEGMDITSMARKDNYRGKYPDEPAAEGVLNPEGDEYVKTAEGYPLTNKLDYVFLKRPMEHDGEAPKVEDYADNEKYQAALKAWEAKWVQTSKENDTDPNVKDATWDTELPYIYGWAEVADPAHPEEVWTTLGMGELDLYNGEDLYGGYHDIGKNPAALTVEGQDFKFADFDFSSKGSASDVYAVKAVYEPGKGLQNTTNFYRMTRAPYYNKFNALEAANGGAYEVEIQIERANVNQESLLTGVARIREPAVRQNTTTDVKWEQNIELGVENNLINPSNKEAYDTKAKTTYTRVDVKNSEIITFSLALSARQNKVDYFLAELYGDNFVVSGVRTETDNNRSKPMNVLDNYNYYAEGNSDETDKYYDIIKYKEREGSRGFVLSGTLNNMMKYAAQYEAEPTNPETLKELQRYVTVATLADANLKLAGGVDIGIFDLMDIYEDLKTLVGHTKGTQYWDAVHNHPILTYHQIQYAILNNGALLASTDDEQEAPIDGLTWCHYHAACAAQTSGKPNSWEEMIEMAWNGGTDDIENLKLLTAGDLADYRLQGTSAATFANDVVNAVARLKTSGAAFAGEITWDHLQHALLNSSDGTTSLDERAVAAKKAYYWYDGTASVDFKDWTTLGTYVKETVTVDGGYLPDGKTVIGAREAKLRQIESIFTANAIAAEDNTSAWVRATENLRVDGENKLTDFEDFIAKAKAIYREYNAWPTWQEAQYYYKNGVKAPSASEPEMVNYWWHFGAYQIDSLEDLLKAAKGASEADRASFDAFNVEQLNGQTYFKFASDYQGTAYTSANFDTFKALAKSYASDSSCHKDWGELQYYIIYEGNCDLSKGAVLQDVVNKTKFFWWKDGGTGKTVTFSTATRGDISSLLEAAYRAAWTKDPAAWDNLDAATIEAYRLIKENDGSTSFDKFPKFTTEEEIAAVKAAVEAVLQSALGSTTSPMPDIPKATWYQAQYYLLNSNTYLPDGDPNLPGSDVYWWLLNNDNVDPAVEFDKLMTMLYKAGKKLDGVTNNTIAAMITPELMATLGIKMPNGVAITDSNINTVKSRIVGIYAKANAQKQVDTVNGKLTCSWYQVAYHIAKNSYPPLANAKTAFATLKYAEPDWVASQANLLALPGQVQEMEVRPAPTDVNAQISELALEISNLTATMYMDDNPANALGYMAELNQLIAQLNELTGYAPAEVVPPVEEVEPPIETTDPPVEETEPPTETTDPPVEETDPAEGETDPTVEETNPTETETKPPVEDTEPPAEETDPTEEETNPPATETDQPDNEANPPTEETNQPDTEETGEPDLVMAIPSDYTQLTFRAPSLMTLPPTAPCDSWLIYFTNSWRYRP